MDPMLELLLERPSFRSSLVALLKLEPDEVDRLVSAVAQHGFTPAAARGSGVSGLEAQLVVYVAQALFQVVRESEGGVDPVALLTEVAHQVRPGDEPDSELIAHQARLITPSPSLIARETHDSVARSIFTNILGVSFEIDLRRIKDDGDVRRFVPVVVGRIGFDENVQVASDGVAFQVTPAVLAEIHRRVRDIEEELAELREDLPDWLA